MTTVSSPIHPILNYSPYVPQQADIENNIQEKIEHTFVTKYTLATTEISRLDTRINLQTQQLDKLIKEFHAAVQYRLCDSMISIILFVVIYVKVYS